MRWIALWAALMLACAHRVERKTGPTLQTVDMGAPFLKAHMRTGDLVILTKWRIDEATKSITGTGQWQGPDRAERPEQQHTIAIANVALFETNTISISPGVAALAVLTGLSLAVTALCLTNPKSCFGSCPTFYAPDGEGTLHLQAEGFSDSIAPALERNDIDALWLTTGRGGHFTLRMTNEAYETHVVKQVDLLAVKRPAGGRVVASEDGLWLAASMQPPRVCRGDEGSCLAKVIRVDDDARSSVTDEHDLATREVIDLEFAPTANAAIVIAARQTFVTTFLLYQGLAYLGSTATSWLARLDKDAAETSGKLLERLLGGIEIQIERDGAWVTVGEIYETGPLATDVDMVRLPTDGARVRLRMAKGSWRIDAVALASIVGEAKPVRVSPSKIAGVLGKEYEAGRTAATAFPIVTQPGDRYDFEYVLPAGENYELFIDSRGYYLEWMRREWIAEENPLAALKMLVDPSTALRELAPKFKKVEPDIERMFWGSRYAK